MTFARDKANQIQSAFRSKGVDDNADALAITIDSSENVGIGTTSPATALDISQANARGAYLRSSTTGSRIHFLDATTASISTVGIGAEGNNLVLYGGGAEQLRCTSGGKVGIGETTPLGKLHIKTADSGGSANANADELILEGAGSGAGVGMGILSATDGFGYIVFGDSGGNAQGGIQYHNNGDSMRIYTNDAERMRIDSAGNVGIGNTTMSSFSSAGATRFVVGDGSGDEGMTIYSGTSSASNIAFADGTSGDARHAGIISYLHSENSMRLFTNGTERMKILSDGKVGIGTNAPAELLEVAGTGAAIQIDSNGDSALRFATSGTVKHSIFSSSGALNFFDNSNSATRATIHTNGVLSASAGVALGVGTANTASNVLDDYEEGTFTPDLDDSSNNSPTSLHQAQGFYTKVGRAVTIQVYVEVNVKGSGMSGNVMRISNLPFTPVDHSLSFHSMAVSYISNIDVNSKPVGGAVYSGNSFIYLYYINGDNSAQITPSMILNGTRIALGGTYMSS